MGLSQSLYIGYSGLHTHQKSMDNIGNNLANVNTVGFKKSDFLFNSLLKKAVSGGAPATGDRSATGAIYSGMGVTTGGIVGNFQQGTPEDTGNPLDCSIVGNGFFMAATTNGMALTRNGSFYLDHMANPSQRQLCVGDGLAVQGWMAQNGVITPNQNPGNIYLPAFGDLLPGKRTENVTLEGILPTNADSNEFKGQASTTIDVKGNISDGASFQTSIFADVTKTGESGSSVSVEEVKVNVAFSGPTVGDDGNPVYTWTMTTVDWPNPGDPGVQIYPTPDDPGFSQGGIAFHATGSTTAGVGAGQAVETKIKPGSAKISDSQEDENGNTVTSSFTLPSDFALDVSRLTNLSDPPTGSGVTAWSVNGNPTGTMARTITTFDEYTGFSAENGVMTPTRLVEARNTTMYYTKTSSDNGGTTWNWSTSRGDVSGELRFDVHGDLVSSQQTGDGIQYNFDDVRSIAHEGTMKAIDQDGYRNGTLESITFDANGKVWGSYTNEVVRPLAQLAIANVPNPSGLDGASGTLFYPGPASGAIMIGVAGDSAEGMAAVGAGAIRPSSLESSNVDLSREFTTLIQTERGYQFNSKIVTTSDEMLQTALQLKR